MNFLKTESQVILSIKKHYFDKAVFHNKNKLYESTYLDKKSPKQNSFWA